MDGACGNVTKRDNNKYKNRARAKWDFGVAVVTKATTSRNTSSNSVARRIGFGASQSRRTRKRGTHAQFRSRGRSRNRGDEHAQLCASGRGRRVLSVSCLGSVAGAVCVDRAGDSRMRPGGMVGSLLLVR